MRIFIMIAVIVLVASTSMAKVTTHVAYTERIARSGNDNLFVVTIFKIDNHKKTIRIKKVSIGADAFIPTVSEIFILDHNDSFKMKDANNWEFRNISYFFVMENGDISDYGRLNKLFDNLGATSSTHQSSKWFYEDVAKFRGHSIADRIRLTVIKELKR